MSVLEPDFLSSTRGGKLYDPSISEKGYQHKLPTSLDARRLCSYNAVKTRARLISNIKLTTIGIMCTVHVTDVLYV